MNNSNHSQLSANETGFFSLSNSTQFYDKAFNKVSLRESDELAPLVEKIYDKLQEQNQTNQYADKIQANLGDPIWDKTIYYSDAEYENGYTVTPIGFYQGEFTEALMLGYVDEQSENSLTIELVTRKEVEAVVNGIVPIETRPNIFNEIDYFDAYDYSLYGNYPEDSRFRSFYNENVELKQSLQSSNEEPCGCDLIAVYPTINNDKDGEGGDGELNGPGIGSGGGGSGGEGGSSGTGNPADDGSLVIIIVTTIWEDEQDDTSTEIEIPPPPNNDDDDNNPGPYIGEGGDDGSDSSGGMPCQPPDPDCIGNGQVLTGDNTDFREEIEHSHFIMKCGGNKFEGIAPHEMVFDSYYSASEGMHLAEEFGLTCDQVGCLFEKDKIFENLKNEVNNIQLTCNNDNPFSELLEDLCDDGFSFETLEEGTSDILNSEDYITNILGRCEKADCILDKILGSSMVNPVCEIMKNFDNNPDWNVTITSGDVGSPDNHPAGWGSTSLSPNTNSIMITLDQEKVCNSDSPFNVAETIMHEFVHAQISATLLHNGWDGQEETWSSAWDDFLELQSIEEGLTEHEYITISYMNPIAEALYFLNGELGSPDDYLGYVAHGLLHDNPILSGYITEDQALGMYEGSLINAPIQPDVFNFDCD